MLNVRRTSLCESYHTHHAAARSLWRERGTTRSPWAPGLKPRTVGDLVRAIAVAAPRAARASTAGGRDSFTGTSTRRDVPVAIACAARDGVDEVAVACAEFGVIRRSTRTRTRTSAGVRGRRALVPRGGAPRRRHDGPVDDGVRWGREMRLRRHHRRVPPLRGERRGVARVPVARQLRRAEDEEAYARRARWRWAGEVSGARAWSSR